MPEDLSGATRPMKGGDFYIRMNGRAAEAADFYVRAFGPAVTRRMPHDGNS